MTTRLTIAGAVLVLAIVFGFIFWNQFSSSQKQLAAGNTPISQTSSSNSKSAVPKNDNISNIESDLSGVNVNTVDTESTQLNSQLNGF